MSDGFNQDKFIAAAKAAGYSDEEINSEIGRQTSQINAATGKEFGKASEEAVQGQAQQWRDQGLPVPGTKEPADTRSLTTQALDWAKTPSGNAVLGGLGLLGLGYAGYQGLKGPSSTGGATQRVEPTLSDKPLSPAERTIGGPAQTDIPAYLRKQQAAPATPAAPTVPETPTMSAEQAAARVAEMPEHPNPITKIEPSTLTQVGNSETAKITKEIPPPTKKAGVAPTTPVESTGGEVKKAVKPKEQHTFKTAAEIPEGMVFRPDVGNLDRSLVNILGPEHRLYAKELINEGKMFGHSNDLNKDVSKITTEYFKALQEQVPETILSRDARKAQGVESKLGTYGSLLGKAAKVGGVAGTLMTIAQSANAKEAARNVGEAFLPWGLTPNTLASGELTPEIRAAQDRQMKEMQKLGSPYRSVPPPKR